MDPRLAAEIEGHRAYCNGQPRSSNPHPTPVLAAHWNTGYQRAARTQAELERAHLPVRIVARHQRRA